MESPPPPPTLPEEVILEILSCLPAKSVARLRTLSRSWRAALSSPFFLELHLRRANKAAPRLFCGSADFKAPVDIDDDDDDKWCFFAFQPGAGGRGGTPLRGLILVRCFDNGGYYVCNPCTGAVLALPDSTRPMKKTFRRSMAQPPPPFYLYVSYGLGYCAATRRYKVFRLFTGGGDGDGKDETCCEVFVLDALAYWRPTAGKPPQGCTVGENNPAVFLDGSLHFLCRDGSAVVTMNVGDETFGSLPAPAPAAGGEILRTITELDGRLCVCQRASESGDGPYHLWLYGGEETARWEKLCCIDPRSWPEDDRNLLRSRWIAPLCMYGEKIMLRTGNCRVFAVDPTGGVAGSPEILFRPDEHEATGGEFVDTLYPTLGLYEESLVPVGRTIEEMVFLSPATRAWSDVLKWLGGRTVAELSVVCREWRAVVTSDRFVRAHAAHPKVATSTRVRFVMDPAFGLPVDVDRVGEVGDDPDISEQPFPCGQPCRGLHAGPLRGALCVACSDRDANTIDVWALTNHNGNAASSAWTMEHRLELAAHSPEYSSEKTTVMGVDPTSGRVWVTTGESLGHYDPKTRELVTVYRVRWMDRLGDVVIGTKFCAVICQERMIRYPF
uniref:F-box domain-containing protein n=1 Tax=Oryza brachyantha TaxID=4533 RepID=J3N2K2_ORYBR